MKRTLALLLVLVICITMLCSCEVTDTTEVNPYHEALAKLPAKDAGGETTLEFWIGDDVEDYDWSGYDEIYGWFGAWEYLGSAYKVTIDEETGEQIKPKYHVSYIVTSYPDYSDDRQCVTRIDITDPSVKIYGLTTESTKEEFVEKFSSLGFTVSDLNSTGNSKKAEKDGVSVFFTPEYNEDTPAEISIRVEVSNKYGIQF